MDYEKVLGEHKFPTYEELKTGLLRLIDEGKISRKDAARLLPELRESEDERIMKKMIEHFKSKTKDTWCNMPVKSILDWLEKQKVLTEHKEGIYYYYRDGTFTFISPPAVENPHNFTVPKPNEKPVDYDHEMWKNCEANFEGGKKEVIDHPEKYGLQKEQKPAWSAEDEKIMQTMIKEGDLKPSEIAWLKSLRPQKKEDLPKWLVDEDYDEKIDGKDFSLHPVGLAYRGFYIPYSDLLKLPREDEK